MTDRCKGVHEVEPHRTKRWWWCPVCKETANEIRSRGARWETTAGGRAVLVEGDR